MNRTYYQALLVGLALLTLSLQGCLDVEDEGTTNVSASVLIAGTATKGPFRSGDVSVFAFDRTLSGGKGALLVAGRTDANGAFSLKIPATYSGPILIEAAGTYRSEATGGDTIVSPTDPIQSVGIVEPGGTTPPAMAVNPVTHMVSREFTRAPGLLDGARLQQVAASLASNLGLTGTDLLSTIPVDVTTNPVGATNARIRYGTILAGIDRMIQDQPLANRNYGQFVNTHINSVRNGGVSTALTQALTTAVDTLVRDSRLSPTLNGNDEVIRLRTGAGFHQTPLVDVYQPAVKLRFTQRRSTDNIITANSPLSMHATIAATPGVTYSYTFGVSSSSTETAGALLSAQLTGTATGPKDLATVFKSTVSGTFGVSITIVPISPSGYSSVSDSLTVIVGSGSSPQTTDQTTVALFEGLSLKSSSGTTGQVIFLPRSRTDGGVSKGDWFHSVHQNSSPPYLLSTGSWSLQSGYLLLETSLVYQGSVTGTMLNTPTLSSNSRSFRVLSQTTNALSIQDRSSSETWVFAAGNDCESGSGTRLRQIRLFNQGISSTDASTSCVILPRLSAYVSGFTSMPLSAAMLSSSRQLYSETLAASGYSYSDTWFNQNGTFLLGRSSSTASPAVYKGIWSVSASGVLSMTNQQIYLFSSNQLSQTSSPSTGSTSYTVSVTSGMGIRATVSEQGENSAFFSGNSTVLDWSGAPDCQGTRLRLATGSTVQNREFVCVDVTGK